jgi:prepilin-type N-terminal cleavage/methylation domain-containing protein
MKNQKGFTLLELLIVIAIIAILAVVVFVALDPLSRFQDARDAQRWSDVTAILDAAKLDQVDNGGAYVAGISGLTTALYYQIGTNGSGCDSGCSAQTTQAACANITALATEGYLPAIPFDPSTGALTASDYYIMQNTTTGVLTVGACDEEGATAIEIAR